MDNYGLLSLVPPIVAIGVAIATKQVIISFFLAAWVGATILAGWNPLMGAIDVFGTYVIPAMSDPGNAAVLFSVLLIGAFAAMIEQGGGAYAFSQAFKKSKLNSGRSAQIVTWLGGLVCFFSDSTNAIIMGPIFRPITDTAKVSREKLAYIVDSTASPVALLVPFSAWGAYLMGLISTQYQELGIDETGLVGLVGSIPFNYYAIGAVGLVFIIAVTGMDYGPMKKAEQRAREEGGSRSSAETAQPNAAFLEVPEGAHPTIMNVVIPLAVLILSLVSMFVWTGGFPEKGFVEALANANGLVSLAFSFFIGSVAATALAVKSKVFSFKKALEVYFDGTRKMVDVVFILVFAWSVGALCKGLGTAAYIVGLTEGFMTPTLMYIAIFVGASITSFSTGSSWGTFAIFMPIAMPMAAMLGAPMYPAIGAVLSGGLFGDHCSPISDTTILSAMGSSCDHIDHVNTQFPYALTAGAAASIAYLAAGISQSMIVGLASMTAALLLVMVVLSRRKNKQSGSSS